MPGVFLRQTVRLKQNAPPLEVRAVPHVVIEAHEKSGVELPLVIVGGAAYGDEYEARLRRMAGPAVRFLGFVFGDGYRELQSHAAVYVQATEVGGTHPALVEAMAFANAIVALDTPEHREVLGDAGRYYETVDELGGQLRDLCADDDARRRLARDAAARAARLFSWDVIAEAYARACATP